MQNSCNREKGSIRNFLQTYVIVYMSLFICSENCLDIVTHSEVTYRDAWDTYCCLFWSFASTLQYSTNFVAFDLLEDAKRGIKLHYKGLPHGTAYAEGIECQNSHLHQFLVKYLISQKRVSKENISPTRLSFIIKQKEFFFQDTFLRMSSARCIIDVEHEGRKVIHFLQFQNVERVLKVTCTKCLSSLYW